MDMTARVGTMIKTIIRWVLDKCQNCGRPNVYDPLMGKLYCYCERNDPNKVNFHHYDTCHCCLSGDICENSTAHPNFWNTRV